jgi:hypothetical protein
MVATRQTTRLTATFLLALTLLAAGCQAPVRLGAPLTKQHAGNEPEARMSFWHSLEQRPITSHDEAFHALLLFFDGEDPAETYPERLDIAKQRGWVDEDFNARGDAAIKRGTLAVALARELEIDGGLWMHLLGPTPRYATRELEHMNIYPPSSPSQTMSGGEFVGLISRVEDYQRLEQAPGPPPAPRNPPRAPVSVAR